MDPERGEDLAVPPELFPALVFGRWGVGGLSGLHDVVLGCDRALLGVLFPRLTIEVYLPI